ncbi:MAG: ZIP family metal transporter [Candidatus Magasanikbacteria bacterium]|nr:ZIP family metal transporter [Candidatus Magasanikbacteria bacterium]
MSEVWLYSILSVFIVSIVSLAGLFTLAIKMERLKKILSYFVSFSAGTLFGDAFIHLLPEAVESYGFGLDISLYLLSGVALWFLIEKIVHWHHCHNPTCSEGVDTFAVMNLFGDTIHNIIDGVIIGASYLVSIPLGIATTFAVFLHEIPQEISDFGVLVKGGFSKKKALFYNFLTALASFIGLIFALVMGSRVEGFMVFVIPFAAGAFIYIAGADLIPELHKEVRIKRSIMQFIFFVAGIGVMVALLKFG